MSEHDRREEEYEGMTVAAFVLWCVVLWIVFGMTIALIWKAA